MWYYLSAGSLLGIGSITGGPHGLVNCHRIPHCSLESYQIIVIGPRLRYRRRTPSLSLSENEMKIDPVYR
jgi:hypothetical protein